MSMPPPQSVPLHGLTSPFGQVAGLPVGTHGLSGVLGSAAGSSSSSTSPFASHITHNIGASGSSLLPLKVAPPFLPHFPPGSAVLRMLEYCDGLSGKGSLHESEILHLSFWRDLTQEFYLPDGVFRQVAWNPAAREQRVFELPTPVIPRYLHTVHLSGVVAHSTSLSRPREWSYGSLTLIPPPPPTKGAILGLPNAQTTHFIQADKAKFHVEYENGWMVVQTGVLRAALAPHKGSLKFQFLDYITTHHESFVPRSRITRGLGEQTIGEETIQRIRDGKRGSGAISDAKKEGDTQPKDEKRTNEDRFVVSVERWSMPENPVNEYGMTLRAMRCLEITESVCQLRDLMDYGAQQNLGPMQALHKLASEFSKAREASLSTGDSSGVVSTNGQTYKETGHETPSGQYGRSNASGWANLKRKNTAASPCGDVKTEVDESDIIGGTSSPNKKFR